MKRRLFAVLIAIAVVLLPLAFAGSASAAERTVDPKCVVNPVACVGGAIGGGVADAVTGDGCDGPPPAAPDLGAQSWLTSKPNPIPPAADPFADGATTTIYEQYGLGWARWRTCDLNSKWLPDAANVTAQADTGFGSWLLSVPVFCTALYAAIVGVAMDPSSWLGWMRPTLEGIVDGLHGGLTDPLIQVLLLVTVVVLLWEARKGAISKVVTAIAMVVLVGGGVAVLTSDPFQYVEDGSTATAAVVGGVSSATATETGHGASDDPATQAVSQVVDVVIYRAWLQGMFGSSDSTTAKEFGPKLLAAGSLNWAETEQVRAGDADDLIEKKQDAWKSTMADLKEKDPEAYEYATGRGEGRGWAAFRSLLAMACVLPILLIGALIILALPMFLLISIVWLLVVLPLAMLPSQSAMSYVRAPLKFALSAAINAVVMGVAMGVQLLAVATLFDPSRDVPVWLALILCALLTVGLWVATRKHRRAIPTERAWKAGKSAAKWGATIYTAGAAGAAAEATEKILENQEEEEAERDSASAERAQPTELVLMEATETSTPKEAEEDSKMRDEVTKARAALEPRPQVPQQRTDGYVPPGAGLLTAVPGEQHWTPEPPVAKRVAGESIPGEDELPADRKERGPTGWPGSPEPQPSEPTGWPQPEPGEVGEEANRTYDDGTGGNPEIWTPEGEMTLEESYVAVKSPAIEVEPADTYTAVEQPGTGWPGAPVEKRTTTFGGSQ